jgi:SAM-dependent methyltransferase
MPLGKRYPQAWWTGTAVDDSLYDEGAAAAYDARQAERFAEAGEAGDLLASLAGGGPVLELGVGTGRLALPLAARGLEVHGVDASAAMVARLRAKPGGEAVHVVVGDFAAVADLVPGLYPLVFVAFNTLFELLTQDAQVRCFAGVASRLASGGVFVVEAFVPDVTRLEAGVSALPAADGVVLRVAMHDPDAQRVEGHNVHVAEGGVGMQRLRARYATVPELDLMARLAGLRLRDRWGGWRREPFTTASRRHVSVYERPT